MKLDEEAEKALGGAIRSRVHIEMGHPERQHARLPSADDLGGSLDLGGSVDLGGWLGLGGSVDLAPALMKLVGVV